jgi:hypothetical protein
MGQIPFVVSAAGAEAPVSATAMILDILRGYVSAPGQTIYLDASGSPITGAVAGSAGAFVNMAPGLYALQFAFPSACATNAQVTDFEPPHSSTGPGKAVFYAIVRGGYVLAPITVSCLSH